MLYIDNITTIYSSSEIKNMIYKMRYGEYKCSSIDATDILRSNVWSAYSRSLFNKHIKFLDECTLKEIEKEKSDKLRSKLSGVI